MQIAKAWIAIVFMVAVARADGPGRAGASKQTPVDPARYASDARALTARIDAVLAARWAEAKVKPAAIADDGEFLRRVSLDLIGKIPTAAEARDFLDDPSKGKRLALVERLLDSPAYTTRATEIWRQLLLPEADTEDLARAGRRQLRGVAPQESDRGGRAMIGSSARSSPPSSAGETPTCRRLSPRLDPSPAAYYHGQGEQAREHRLGRGDAFSWDPPGMRPVPQSPVRELEAGTVLEPGRLLRGRAGRGA